MRLWTREIAGWGLVALGLYVFYRDYEILTDGNHFIVEGGMLTLIGIFLFRGGIQLLKIAVAARVCLETQERLERYPSKPGMPGSPRASFGAALSRPSDRGA